MHAELDALAMLEGRRSGLQEQLSYSYIAREYKGG